MSGEAERSPARRALIFPLAIAALGLLLLPKLWLAEAAVYRELLTPWALLLIAGPAKLLFLALAALFAWRAAAAFGPGNPARRGWRLIAMGFASCCVAQAILVFYQIGLRQPTPYPSASDPFWVAGMVLLLIALLGFLRTYTDPDLHLASRRQAAVLAAVTLPPLLALGAWLLRPVLAAPAPLLEQALNVTYPVLDCLLLAPTLVLARITRRMRGGHLHAVWTVLLAGFVFTAAGDVFFGYFSTLGMERLDPLVDFLYATSYALWAWGAFLKRRVVGGGPG